MYRDMYILSGWMLCNPIPSSQKFSFIDHTSDTRSFKKPLMLVYSWYHTNNRLQMLYYSAHQSKLGTGTFSWVYFLREMELHDSEIGFWWPAMQKEMNWSRSLSFYQTICMHTNFLVILFFFSSPNILVCSFLLELFFKINWS